MGDRLKDRGLMATARSAFGKEYLVKLLQEKDPEKIATLYRDADRVREEFMGNDIHIRGIIEFSNVCKRDFLYCGLRKSNKELVRYRMDGEEIWRAALEAKRLNFKTVVLQSGEDPYLSGDDLSFLIGKIKKLEMAVTLSIGERFYEDYRRFREAGADRYLLKFETSSPELFKKLKPDSCYEERFQCLAWLKELGYQVGSGNMVGLPGQSWDDLAEDLILFRKLDLDMIGIGPWIPHPHTPLKDHSTGELETVLKVIALTRLLNPDTHIPATTAVGTIHPAGREKALCAGANVIMPNVTPGGYRRYYEIYPHKICIEEEPANCRLGIEAMISSLGRRVGIDFGHRVRRRRPASSTL